MTMTEMMMSMVKIQTMAMEITVMVKIQITPTMIQIITQVMVEIAERLHLHHAIAVLDP